MSSLVGGPSMVGGLGPGSPAPPPKSGPVLSDASITAHPCSLSVCLWRLIYPAAGRDAVYM